MPKPNTTDMHLRSMPRGLYRAWKAYCAKRGVPMNKGVEVILRYAMEQGLSLHKAMRKQKKKPLPMPEIEDAEF